MSFDLDPFNEGVEILTINQSAWPPIWRWLCNEAGNLAPFRYVRAGLLNNGLVINGPLAEYFATIVEKRGVFGPDELRDEYVPDGKTRAERLARFFRASGGFRIR